MRFFFLVLLIASAIAYYGSMDSNFASWAITIKEWEQQLPVSIWHCTLGLAFILLLLSVQRKANGSVYDVILSSLPFSLRLPVYHLCLSPLFVASI